jgi:hypothetical protein
VIAATTQMKRRWTASQDWAKNIGQCLWERQLRAMMQPRRVKLKAKFSAAQLNSNVERERRGIEARRVDASTVKIKDTKERRIGTLKMGADKYPLPLIQVGYDRYDRNAAI